MEVMIKSYSRGIMLNEDYKYNNSEEREYRLFRPLKTLDGRDVIKLELR